MTPRESHRAYWGMILPKDDPFWRTEQPGNVWGCRCDLEETSLPAGDPPARKVNPAAGLDVNPGIGGEIFTPKAAYYRGVTAEESKRADSALRYIMLKEALAALRNVSVRKETDGQAIDVKFTRKGLEHVQSDWFPDKALRDIILPKMDKIMKQARYLKTEGDIHENIMISRYHYFEIELFGRRCWLHVRETKDGVCYLYAMSTKD